MKTEMILRQMARNTNLLTKDLSAEILAGNMPPIEEIVMAVLIAGMDAYKVIVGSQESSWNEKRQARLALAGEFLSAMAVVKSTESVDAQ